MHRSRGARRASRTLVVARAADALGAWRSEAAQQGREFMRQRGHLLADPSLAGWVLEECAALIAEREDVAPGWDALPISELWRRLDNLQRFFPQPRLVVAHDEVLRAFLPWLGERGVLTAERSAQLLAELTRSGTSTLRRARAQLMARHATAVPGGLRS